MENYNEYFIELLDELKNSGTDEYIGIGNPNSRILFIGTEAGMDSGSPIKHGSPTSWLAGDGYLTKRYVPDKSTKEGKKLRNLNQTWQRYQKLYNVIINELGIIKPQQDKYEITFVEDIFTTELSALPAPNNSRAKENPNFSKELMRRKRDFFKQDFIKKFQVIVIFTASRMYMETYRGEVCDLFEVDFKKQHFHDGKSKIWINMGMTIENEPKLVIHTRHLSRLDDSNLIPELGKIISSFLMENGKSSLI